VLNISLNETAKQIRVKATSSSPLNYEQKTSGAIAVIVTGTTGIDEMLSATPLKAWTQNGLLHVSGVKTGETLTVYNASGALVHQSIAASNEVDIIIPVSGTYIVRSGDNSVKVVIQ